MPTSLARMIAAGSRQLRQFEKRLARTFRIEGSAPPFVEATKECGGFDRIEEPLEGGPPNARRWRDTYDALRLVEEIGSSPCDEMIETTHDEDKARTRQPADVTAQIAGPRKAQERAQVGWQSIEIKARTCLEGTIDEDQGRCFLVRQRIGPRKGHAMGADGGASELGDGDRSGRSEEARKTRQRVDEIEAPIIVERSICRSRRHAAQHLPTHDERSWERIEVSRTLDPMNSARKRAIGMTIRAIAAS